MTPSAWTLEPLETWGALQYAQQIGGKVVDTLHPHFWCKLCPEMIYRLGGYAHAGAHFKAKHPGGKFDVRIEMRRIK